MKNILNFLDRNKSFYAGGERAARPYRDWYILVSISLLCLFGMIFFYGYVMLSLAREDVLAEGLLLEKSLSKKVNPRDVEVVVKNISEQEAGFLQLLASSTPVADPSR